MTLVFSPVFRPSLPQGCRKRSCGQGQALPGRYAGLDHHARASGQEYSRATDEEASGGGFVKGSSQPRDAKTATTPSASRLSPFVPMPTHGGRDTCKPVPAHAPHRSPNLGVVTARQASRCPCRHAHHAGHTEYRMRIGWPPHDAQVSAAYRFPVSWMRARCCRHVHQPRAGCDPASRPIRTRRDPNAHIMRPRFCADACSFVRHYPRGPAYVSPIRGAYRLTAGEGRRPFEPRKTQRQGKR